jgi:hypothetical protein
MRAKELAVILESLGNAYVQGGIRKSAPPLNALVKDLHSQPDLDLHQVRQNLLAGKKPGGAKRSSSRKPPQLRTEVVNQYVSAFERADGDRARFADCLSRLKLDKRIRAGQELPEILARYSGGTLTGSNKAKRLEQIEAAYIVRQTKIRNREVASSARPF